MERSGVTIEGKNAVVLGRSNIVGIPVAMLLMQKNATVTIAHSRTKEVEKVINEVTTMIIHPDGSEIIFMNYKSIFRY